MAGFDDWIRTPKPAQADLCYTRGDSWELCFILRDFRNRVVDLTGYTGTLETFDNEGGMPLQAGTVTIPNPTAGEVLLAFTDLESALLVQSGFYRVRLTDPGGRVSTVLCGTISEFRKTQVAGCGFGGNGCGSGCAVSGVTTPANGCFTLGFDCHGLPELRA